MSRILFALLCLNSYAAAYDCNITAFLQQTDTRGMCDFVNYHSFMIGIFGISSVVSLIAIVIMLMCNGCKWTDNIRKRFKFTMGLVVLAFGLEFFVMCVFLYLIIIISQHAWARSNAVTNVIEVVVTEDDFFVLDIEDPTPPEVTTPIVTEDELFVLAIEDFILPEVPTHVFVTTECSICMTEGGANWETTKCGHMFHTHCIESWKIFKASKPCPLCRAPM